MSEVQDQPATLTDDDIETRRVGVVDPRAADTGDDSGDVGDPSDSGDDSGDTGDPSDTGDDSGDTGDPSDTGDDSSDA